MGNREIRGRLEIIRKCALVFPSSNLYILIDANGYL